MSTHGWLYRLGVLTACLLVHIFAAAQPLGAGALARVNQAPDLKFPEEAAQLSFFSPLTMAIYRPTGAGPFPALVILHSCGGLRQEIRDWTKLALEQGYVVFVLDSLSQRGVKDGCSPATWVQPGRGAKDALQALEHLRKLAFVEPDRIGLVGFSWGAMVGLFVSSGAIANQFSSSRYAAVASFYPICYFPGNRQFPAVEWLRPEVDKPLLVLMGEKDTEAPAAECVSRLEGLKQKDAPVEWHVYPATTHCWDCSTLNNFSKTDWLGNRVVYRYDSQVTQDSAERLFAFLAKRLKAGK